MPIFPPSSITGQTFHSIQLDWVWTLLLAVGLGIPAVGFAINETSLIESPTLIELGDCERSNVVTRAYRSRHAVFEFDLVRVLFNGL